MQLPDNTALKIYSGPGYVGIPTFDCPTCGGSGDNAHGGLCDAEGCDSGQVPNPHYLRGCNPAPGDEPSDGLERLAQEDEL